MFNFFRKQMNKETPLEILQAKINDNTTLDEAISIFEKVCKRFPIKEEMKLFETGTFRFDEGKMFYFSLVRQVPNDEEEYVQLHVDILYDPSEKTAAFQSADWDEEIEGDFFSHIRTSDVYKAVKDDRIALINVFEDET